MSKRKEDISFDIFLNNKNVMENMDERTKPIWDEKSSEISIGRKLKFG